MGVCRRAADEVGGAGSNPAGGGVTGPPNPADRAEQLRCEYMLLAGILLCPYTARFLLSSWETPSTVELSTWFRTGQVEHKTQGKRARSEKTKYTATLLVGLMMYGWKWPKP